MKSSKVQRINTKFSSYTVKAFLCHRRQCISFTSDLSSTLDSEDKLCEAYVVWSTADMAASVLQLSEACALEGKALKGNHLKFTYVVINDSHLSHILTSAKQKKKYCIIIIIFNFFFSSLSFYTGGFNVRGFPRYFISHFVWWWNNLLEVPSSCRVFAQKLMES